MTLAVGQQWTYRAPVEVAHSRLVVGAILAFEGPGRIVCLSVTGALQTNPDGSVVEVTIPFLPMTESAVIATIVAPDGTAPVADGFAEQFEAWHGDTRGHSYFTVPFEGSLDRMIALQMAEIVNTQKA
jgi:hypothetical protein